LTLSLVNALPLEEDGETAEQIPARTLTLARKHGLTIYAAASQVEITAGGARKKQGGLVPALR